MNRLDWWLVLGLGRNRSVHWFLVGCMNPCLQGSGVWVGSSRAPCPCYDYVECPSWCVVLFGVPHCNSVVTEGFKMILSEIWISRSDIGRNIDDFAW